MKRRSGLSSIYGFILIFLLSMASIQTWSYTVNSETDLENAFLREHQIQQMQSDEKLALTESEGNLTISNIGLGPTRIEYLRFLGSNTSRTLEAGLLVPSGSSIVERVPQSSVVQVVTSLGNTFVYSPPFAGHLPLSSGVALREGFMNAQLFQSPFSQTSFFLSAGSVVYAFSTSGSLDWSFDAGSGFVTDVLPLANGDVYVSTGYGSESNTGFLFELGANGSVMHTIPARVLQTVGSSDTGVPVAVVKGLASHFVLYDGWFYSGDGLFASLQSESLPLAGSDSSDFYFYRVTAVPYADGSCQSPGSEVLVSSYRPSPLYAGGIKLNWNDYAYLGSCNRYPPQLLGSAVDGGLVATLFASPPFAASLSETYPPENPYLVAVSTDGRTLYSGQAPFPGYTSIATNGTDVYMALPSLGEVQVFSLRTGSYTTYTLGIPGSQLLLSDNRLFVFASSTVEVFTPGMVLLGTIDFGRLTLASWSNSFSKEQALMAPSFLVLNGSEYAALLNNGTGLVTLDMGRYP